MIVTPTGKGRGGWRFRAWCACCMWWQARSSQNACPSSHCRCASSQDLSVACSVVLPTDAGAMPLLGCGSQHLWARGNRSMRQHKRDARKLRAARVLTGFTRVSGRRRGLRRVAPLCAVHRLRVVATVAARRGGAANLHAPGGHRAPVEGAPAAAAAAAHRRAAAVFAAAPAAAAVPAAAAAGGGVAAEAQPAAAAAAA